MPLQQKFLHHVYFWLRNPENAEDKNALIAGLRQLAQSPIVPEAHIGQPAQTNRDVVENTYSVSWLIVFDSPEDQEAYQPHPDHQEFVKNCSHLWSKVIVYDSVAAR